MQHSACMCCRPGYFTCKAAMCVPGLAGGPLYSGRADDLIGCHYVWLLLLAMHATNAAFVGSSEQCMHASSSNAALNALQGWDTCWAWTPTMWAAILPSHPSAATSQVYDLSGLHGECLAWHV